MPEAEAVLLAAQGAQELARAAATTGPFDRQSNRPDARRSARADAGAVGRARQKRKHYSKSKSRRGSLRGGFPFSEGSSENKTATIAGGRFDRDHRDEEFFVLGRPGSDLLFQALRLSTIGAGEFYGRVRDGIGYRPPAKTTRPAKDE